MSRPSRRAGGIMPGLPADSCPLNQLLCLSAMARLDGPAGPYLAFEVQFINAGSFGTRLVWADSWLAARKLICAYPSCFGLTERVLVLRVREIPMDEQGMSDERRAA